jgi:hypothetical protein
LGSHHQPPGARIMAKAKATKSAKKKTKKGGKKAKK